MLFKNFFPSSLSKFTFCRNYRITLLRDECIGKQICIDMKEKVSDFKRKLERLFGVPVYKQRLMYRLNKQIENGNYMVAFNLKPNEIIVLMSRTHSFTRNNEPETYNSISRSCLQEFEEVGTNCISVKESDYYRVGDTVDFLDQLAGCWYEGQITRIYVDAEDARLAKFDGNIKSCESSLKMFSDNDSDCVEASESKYVFEAENISKNWCVHLKNIDEVCEFYNFSTNVDNSRYSNQILRNLSNDKTKFTNKSGFVNKKHCQTITPKSGKAQVHGTGYDSSRHGSKNHKRPMNKKKLSLQDNDNRIKISDDCTYKIENLSYFNEPHSYCELYHVRPRANNLLSLEDLRVGQIVMVNYNLHDPEKLGLWFDAKIVKVVNSADENFVIADLLTRPHKNVKIWMTDHIYEIEESTLLMNRQEHKNVNTLKRPIVIICQYCRDSITKNCKKCGCCVCGGKPNSGKMILCDSDQCETVSHLTCFQPPLAELPNEWYCDVCNSPEEEESKQSESHIEIVHKETGKLNEKSTNKNSSISYTISHPSNTRPKSSKIKIKKTGTIVAHQKPDHIPVQVDSCVGGPISGISKRKHEKCETIVANENSNYIPSEVDSCVFGPIPGIPVGTVWHSRVEAAKAGVHRMFVSGIHGKKNIGAFSIILSHGYENDDRGNVFWYTGSGKNEDQELSGLNRTLALNCNAPVDDEKGAESTDWKQGKPVRVLRSFKAAKTSKYAPKKGVRYDGLYKVVKYECVMGVSGFKIWKFFMQRDDESPPPWDDEAS